MEPKSLETLKRIAKGIAGVFGNRCEVVIHDFSDITRSVIHIEGTVDEKIGWIYDHKVISGAMAPLLEVLDHGYLNDIEGLESPTIEIMAAWFWRKLEPQLPGLAEIVIYETPTARCSFRGEASASACSGSTKPLTL